MLCKDFLASLGFPLSVITQTNCDSHGSNKFVPLLQGLANYIGDWG